MKLFIPATLFKIIYSEKAVTDDDYVFVSEKKSENSFLLKVQAEYKGKIITRESFADENSDRELMLSRMVFSAMQEFTGITPSWGVITGVRPVKTVNRLLNEGKTREEISDILENKYLCSKNKCEIAYQTAMTQKNILSEIKDNSFSLYVSIPFCPSRCSYCSFVSQSVEMCLKEIPTYLENLCKEIEYTAEITRKLGLVLDTIYFGGGTPTTLEAFQLEKLIKCIEKNFDLSNLREYTVEAGRPDTITEEKLSVLKENGVGRISINPQTLNDKVLENIGRKHTAGEFFDSFSLARKTGFDVINTDIIAGLPGDTPDSFKNTLESIIKLSPENITVHTLSIKRAAKLNHDERPKGKSYASEMIEYADKRLWEEGYRPYYLYRQKNMMDNLENIGWAKPGYENLYNIYIMEEIQTIIAVGAAGSTKLIRKSPKDERGNIERIFNYKFPLEYNRHFQLMLERKDKIEEFYAD